MGVKFFWIFVWSDCEMRPTVAFYTAYNSYRHLVGNLWIKNYWGDKIMRGYSGDNTLFDWER